MSERTSAAEGRVEDVLYKALDILGGGPLVQRGHATAQLAIHGSGIHRGSLGEHMALVLQVVGFLLRGW